jgi:hypothetical protein
MEVLWRLLVPSNREWRLFHDDMTMECRIVSVPEGAEIQYVYGGQPYHSFVHATRIDAEEEARQKRIELIERGWVEHAREADVAQA